MKEIKPDYQELEAIATSLDILRHRLKFDLARVRRLPESQIAQALRMHSQGSCARADALVQRIVQLRMSIDSRRRTLDRLRARMRQLRGGAKPH